MSAASRTRFSACWIERAARLSLYLEMMDAKAFRRRHDDRAQQPPVPRLGRTLLIAAMGEALDERARRRLPGAFL